MPPTDPGPARETLLAFGRHLDRTTRRVGELDELLTQLATDVATLVSRAGPNEGGPPRSWLLTEDPDQAVADLQDLTEWLGRVYLRYPGAALPSCWAWHPAVIEELWWLRQAHREAYAPGTRSVAKAGDWHDRHRPGVATRLQPLVRDCDLSRHTTGGDRLQDPPQPPLAADAGWLAGHWANGGTPLPTATQLAGARLADQRQRTRGAR